MPWMNGNNNGLKSLFVGLVLVGASAALGMAGYIYSRDMGRVEQAVSQIAENQKSIAVILDRVSNATEDRSDIRDRIREINIRCDDIMTRLKKQRQSINYIEERIEKLEGAYSFRGD